jgi:toxin YhaV
MARAYLQGNPVGREYTHWRLAKFFQRYRHFFRSDRQAKIIAYGWVNDERTKRVYDSNTDAYAVRLSECAVVG